MKKIFVLPMLVMACAAGASTTFYYDAGYDGTNGCTGLFLNPNATSCSQAVTQVSTPAGTASKSFAGYYVGNTQVIDRTGTVVIDRGTASSLFANSPQTDPTAKDNRAGAAYAGAGTITISNAHLWYDQARSYQGWYSCSATGFYMCNEGGDYVAPPAVNCWSWGTYPQNTGYDYVFNSYRLVGDTYVGPSSNSVYENGQIVSGWNNQYPSGVATGDSVRTNGCSDKTLGPLTNDGTVSQFKVYSFACALFQGTRSNTWSDSLAVTNGHIQLDNSTPGKCIYNLICESGYKVSGTAGVQCQGLECKPYKRDNIPEMLGTCVEDVH